MSLVSNFFTYCLSHYRLFWNVALLFEANDKSSCGANSLWHKHNTWTHSLQVQPAGRHLCRHCRNKCIQWAQWSVNLLFFSIIAAQALKEDFPLSHVISPFTNQERREGMLLNLLIPFVLTVGSGSKGLINLTKGSLLLLLCFLTTSMLFLFFLFPRKVISWIGSKWF